MPSTTPQLVVVSPHLFATAMTGSHSFSLGIARNAILPVQLAQGLDPFNARRVPLELVCLLEVVAGTQLIVRKSTGLAVCPPLGLDKSGVLMQRLPMQESLRTYVLPLLMFSAIMATTIREFLQV